MFQFLINVIITLFLARVTYVYHSLQYIFVKSGITYIRHITYLYKTNNRINSFRVTNKDILSIIKSLVSSKSHGCDNISIKMIKICSELVTILLKTVFEESLKKGIFPEIWKKLM